MNIARLKNFTEIVKNNFNISATAEKLYTSQPTLSKQMKMLEDELGLALFTRKGKNLVGLTPMGEQVMELAKGVVAQVEQIGQLSLGDQLATSGVLRIATTHTQARYKLPAVITEFSRRYPEVAIQLHHLLACAGQADQILPLAGKESEPQLIFQHLHLLAEGGLGGVELLRRRRDIEVVLHNLGKVL